MPKKSIFLKVALIVAASAVMAGGGHATVEWEISHTITLNTAPLDVAVSADGKIVCVLTDNGKVLIYSAEGQLTDEFLVGEHAEQIKLGPAGERLFVSSRKNKTIEIITVDYIKTIDTSGAPFKGPPQAPVVIAVFSDFE